MSCRLYQSPTARTGLLPKTHTARTPAGVGGRAELPETLPGGTLGRSADKARTLLSILPQTQPATSGLPTETGGDSHLLR